MTPVMANGAKLNKSKEIKWKIKKRGGDPPLSLDSIGNE